MRPGAYYHLLSAAVPPMLAAAAGCVIVVVGIRVCPTLIGLVNCALSCIEFGAAAFLLCILGAWAFHWSLHFISAKLRMLVARTATS